MTMRKKYDENNLPKHIAIIMDGNGRWAKKRMLPRLLGHSAGVDALKKVVDAAKEIGIKYMSFYAFSTENWKRDKNEVDGIFDLVRKHIKENYQRLIDDNIKIVVMGQIERLPSDLKDILVDLIQKTQNNTGMVVNMGLSYGARPELVRAFNNLAEKGFKNITEKDIENELYTRNLPDPDLIIRTSGEQRLSNFMLFQAAYSELWFPKIHWPDFDKKWLIKAIIEYQKRERRYGNVKQ